MSERARDGALLDQLIARSVPICQEAERGCPRQGRGRKPMVPDWVLTVLIMVAVMLKKKTKSAQYRWWSQHASDFVRWMPGQPFPGRSTFFDRYRRVHRLYQQAILLQGHEAIAQGRADGRCVAVDKSLIEGCLVDADTTWGISTYDGWIRGYAFEVVVTASANGVVWPLLASVDTASRSEQKTILDKIPDLPAQTKYILADAGYDSNAVGEKVEWNDGRRTGRRFLCPEVPRPNNGRSRQPASRQSKERQRHRRLRDRRRRFLYSPRGRVLYARRKTRVEPFHAQLKRLFELHDRVWHRGLDNNRTMVLAAICAYQLLLKYNHDRGRPIAHLQSLLDAL